MAEISGPWLRLELLKLAHTHGKDPKQVIEIAEAYEGFVTADKAETPRQKKVERT
jgi:hypothetical protein